MARENWDGGKNLSLLALMLPILLLPVLSTVAAEGDGKWVEAKPMVRARGDNVAVLLGGAACSTGRGHSLCGKVLVFGSTEANRTAEIYDPKEDRWSSTGSLNSPQTGLMSRAALLPDGTVLAVGGSLGGLSAEIFEPDKVDKKSGRKGSWRLTAPPPTPREPEGYTLTGLFGPACVGRTKPHCRKALIVGGNILGDGKAVELYDPEGKSKDRGKVMRGSWSPSAPLSVPRWLHTATLITASPCGLRCGNVLVVGGNSNTNDSDDPTGQNRAAKSAELYDPVSESWTPTSASISSRVGQHTSIQASTGKVLVAGGNADPPWDEISEGQPELYDPVDGTWNPTAPLGGRYVYARMAPLQSGRVLLAGGSGPAQIYDPHIPDSTGLDEASGGGWRAIDPLTPSRSHFPLTLVDCNETARVLAPGGVSAGGSPRREVNLFIPGQPESEHRSETPIPQEGCVGLQTGIPERPEKATAPMQDPLNRSPILAGIALTCLAGLLGAAWYIAKGRRRRSTNGVKT